MNWLLYYRFFVTYLFISIYCYFILQLFSLIPLYLLHHPLPSLPSHISLPPRLLIPKFTCYGHMSYCTYRLRGWDAKCMEPPPPPLCHTLPDYTSVHRGGGPGRGGSSFWRVNTCWIQMVVKSDLLIKLRGTRQVGSVKGN